MSTKFGIKHPWVKGTQGFTSKNSQKGDKEFSSSPNQRYDIII